MSYWPPKQTDVLHNRINRLTGILAQGIDNPLTHAGSLEALYRMIRDFSDLRPTREQIQLNHVEWLVRMMQWTASHIAPCPDCPVWPETMFAYLRVLRRFADGWRSLRRSLVQQLQPKLPCWRLAGQ
jgi:hypothetical protein